MGVLCGLARYLATSMLKNTIGGVLGASWGRLGGVLGVLETSWRRLGGVLEASWRRLGRLGGVLEASWASWRRLGGVLEASWKRLGGVLATKARKSQLKAQKYPFYLDFVTSTLKKHRKTRGVPARI